MAHAIGANHPLQKYQCEIGFGVVATAVTSLINPLAGAVMGVYFVTDITSNLVADHFNWGEGSPLAKIMRVALTTLLSWGAAFGAACCLTGAVVALTPGVMAAAVSVLCISILASLAKDGAR